MRTSREIERTNKYENKWKIKTNINKFTILSISAVKPHKIYVDNKQYNISDRATILGLQLKRTGIVNHSATRLAIAKKNFSKIKRFYKLSPGMIMHLYKSLIRPVLEYPVIPLCLMPVTTMKKYQILQNKVIRFATKMEDTEETMEEKHRRFKLDAINVRFHKRTQKLWSKFELDHQEIITRSEELTRNGIGSHAWWKRTTPYAGSPEPDPIYIYR